MNAKIRALQGEHELKYLEANELLSKPDPTDEERTKASTLIGEIKGLKARITTEFKTEEDRQALDGIRKDRDSISDEKSFLWNGTRAGGDGAALMGMKGAGSVFVDSYGTALADAGEGTFGLKAWEAMQTRDYKRGFVNMVRRKGNWERGMPGDQVKALQEGLDDQGGIFVPADSLMRIVGREPTPARLAGMVTNITTGRDRVVMPRKQYSADDLYSTAFRATWTGELPSSDTQADVDDTNLLGNIEIPVFTAMLSASLTNDMVEDSAFPIQQWLENELRIVYELLRDNMILNGTGVSQPTGLLAVNANDVDDITTAGVGVIAGDDLFDTAYAIPEQYDDACSWVFNKTSTARAIAKLKDTQNRYLFGQGVNDSGIASARPKELIGYPYAYSGFMPNVATGNFAAIFGDFRGYYLVNRLGITIQVLRETKAKRNQFELVARLRFGGRPVEPWKLRRLKIQ